MKKCSVETFLMYKSGFPQFTTLIIIKFAGQMASLKKESERYVVRVYFLHPKLCQSPVSLALAAAALRILSR
jgi:hypothetical protein